MNYGVFITDDWTNCVAQFHQFTMAINFCFDIGYTYPYLTIIDMETGSIILHLRQGYVEFIDYSFRRVG